MQPFVTAENIKDAYWRYIETSYPIRSDRIRQQFRELVENNNLLWQESFISLSRPYKKSGSLINLIEKGILEPKIQKANFGIEELWQHQVSAIECLSTYKGTPKNTIVATGTGSGKTQAFLIPIVDHCLRNLLE